MVNKDNYAKIEFKAQAENVALARLMLSGFLSRYDCKMDMLEELKIAISEAVSNAIIHGYLGDESKIVTVEFIYANDEVELKVIDNGVGIGDVKKAMEVAYSSKCEHMGLGFSFMDSFSDLLEVQSKINEGTVVCMHRFLSQKAKDVV